MGPTFPDLKTPRVSKPAADACSLRSVEPMLRALVGEPTDEPVVVDAEHQAVLDEARLKLATVTEVIKKAKADEARRSASDSEESDSESSQDEEVGTRGG